MEVEVRQLKIPNDILNYFYLGLLVMCFILALGNRPQGSKWAYTGAFIGFALITCYMTACAIYLAVIGIQQVAALSGGITVGTLFSNKIFFNIVVSLAATIGLYLISSLLFVSGCT
jgi:chitin synthase